MPIPSSYINARKTGTLINGWLVDKTCLHTLGYDQLDGATARRETPLIISVDGDYGKELAPIQGIVNDHYCNHRTTGKSPCIYYVAVDEETKYWTDDTYLAIRCREGQQQQVLDLVAKLQKEIFYEQTPELKWMSDLVDAQYKDDRLIAQVYSLFATMAIIICCLGLLGLSLFDIRQRYREIAIRKAHGAHRRDLYLLLGRKYIFDLLSAFALSIPVTYLLIRSYTESFVESAPLKPSIYVEAFCLVLIISILTLAYQLERAAQVNISKTIKSE